MRIYQPAMGVGTAYPENSFVVIDDYGAEIGRGGVTARMLPRMYPERPLALEMSFHAEEAAADLLFGAVTARASRLRAQNGNPAARLFIRCPVGDETRRAYFARMGFDDYDGLELFALDVAKAAGQRRFAPPLSTGIIAVDLTTRARRDRFVKDLALAGAPEHAGEWLEEQMRGEVFIARAIYMGQEAVGQALITGTRKTAEIQMIHTVPKWRRQGAATALLYAAAEALSEQRVPWLTARSERRNARASHLFQRCGFGWIRTEELLLGENL